MSIIHNNTNQEGSIQNLLIYKEHLVKTGFMDKYDLLVDTVIYNAYLDTTTKEICFQQESGTLCFDFSLSGLPDVNITNLTAGDILMFDGTNWVNTNLDFALDYTRTTQSSRFPDILSVSSVIDALDKILYPYVKPTFTSFTIQGKPTTLELGQYLSTSTGGTDIFNWGFSNVNNISLTNGYSIVDITANQNIVTNILPRTTITNTSNILYPIMHNTNGSTHVFVISGKDTNGGVFQKSLTLTWQPRIFWGTSTKDTILTNAEIMALVNSNTGGSKLTGVIQNSITMDGNGQYIWICMPVSFGKAIEADGSISKFLVGGLANSFWNLFTVSFTNQYGYTSSYYLYRSVTVSFGTSIKIQIV